ncbi:PST family polysaccharide transporter [Novosphingobium chloroacetimidivorans]|uniref:PST family polysaccharide transporter n=1 Tax=Novosphingobium chloroacetimidivorans TaxID=1428314 RepID=A0A7W7NW50_9SPHN|nr:lipopolysaccharide biosynthesis protein [Novosphingobium chloroacetimidivorans]MBB4857737.1 PST family polysaccharide transporter [Novosphingobium chloroacetimidivorans]
MTRAGSGKVLGSVVWGMGGAAGQALFQLLVFVVLARTLSPAAFGVVAIATAVIDLLNFIGRGGITEVLVQRRDLDQRTMNAGFFASLISGAGLTVILALSAPWMAEVFDTPDLREVMLLLAPICLLYASGAVYEGILRHSFQFKQLALRNTTATVVSGLVALAMALTGWGVYALVAQRLIATVWSLLAMMVATRWRPTLDIDAGDMAVQLRQGSAIALSSVLGAGNQRIVDLVVGYFLGPVALGYLRIAWRMLDLLYELVVRPIANVAMTTLPKALHAGRSVEDEYIALLRYSSIFVMPVFVGLAVVAPDVVPMIFGEQWATSAGLLSMLCFVGVFIPLTNFKGSVLIAHGAYRHVLYLNALECLLALLCAAAFAPFGLVSATVGYIVRAAITTPLGFVYLQRVAGVSASRSARAAVPAVVSVGVMLAATFALRQVLPPDLAPIWRVVLLVCLGAVTYGAAVLATDRKLLADAARLRASRRAADREATGQAVAGQAVGHAATGQAATGQEGAAT